MKPNKNWEVEGFCECCGEELTAEEIYEGQNKCFPCLKGNCEICGEGE